MKVAPRRVEGLVLKMKSKYFCEHCLKYEGELTETPFKGEGRCTPCGERVQTLSVLEAAGLIYDRLTTYEALDSELRELMGWEPYDAEEE